MAWKGERTVHVDGQEWKWFCLGSYVCHCRTKARGSNYQIAGHCCVF